jgi:hypothetical protein
MHDPARTAAPPTAVGAVWSELARERQTQVVALLVRLALQWARQGSASGTVRGAEEVSDGDRESGGQDPW